MSRVAHEKIMADERFRADIEKARVKAQKVCDKTHDRLRNEEEKLLAKLTAIQLQRREVFKDVYRPIFDPLEEAAYAAAEKRIGGGT